MTDSKTGGRELAALTADSLAFAMEMQSGSDLGEMADVRGRAKALINAIENKSRDARVAERSSKAACLAVVAFVDEIVSHGTWPWVDEWMQRPLAFELYKEANAGETFYARVDELRHQASPADDDLGALEVFATVLALGYRGRYDDEDGAAEIRKLMQSITGVIEKARGVGEDLSPHAIAPPTVRAQLRKVPLWTIGVGALVLVALVALVLHWRLSVRWDTIAEQLTHN